MFGARAPLAQDKHEMLKDLATEVTKMINEAVERHEKQWAQLAPPATES